MILIAFGSFVLLLFVGVAFAGFAWAAAGRFSRDDERADNLRRMLWWQLKGVALPCALWALMNASLSIEWQPFMPTLQATARGSLWLAWYVAYVGAGFAVINSFWTAATVGWLAWHARGGLDGEARSDYRGLCWTSFGAMALPAIFCVWVGGWLALGLAVTLLFLPVAGYAPEILHKKRLPPMYSRAIARMKFGKYSEAEQEVLRQLENCENDF